MLPLKPVGILGFWGFITLTCHAYQLAYRRYFEYLSRVSIDNMNTNLCEYKHT